MKLSKLFLILPVFAMVACANNPVQPSEEDRSLITKEQFDAAFQEGKLFKEDDVVFKAHFEGEGTVILEAEDGVAKIYGEGDKEEDYIYFYFEEGKGFDIVKYDGMGWYATHYSEDRLQEKLVDYAAFLPFEYKDIKRDDEKKAYVMTDTRMTVGEEDLTIEEAIFKFEDGKPVSVDFDFYFTNKPSDGGTFHQTYTYGNAHVIPPK